MVEPVTVSRPLGDRSPEATLYYGADCIETLRQLPAGSVHCCVTSPPYWGLRDYGTGDAQIGLEGTPEEYVAKIVAVFREVRRVLRDDGTLWLNLGDSYAQARGHGHWESRDGKGDEHGQKITQRWSMMGAEDIGLKPKDLVGIPWRVAFALQADGWYLRSDIIWAKGSVMPESVTDRPTKSHEYLFLLSKSPRYFYDADAIKEPLAIANAQRTTEHYDTTGRGPRDGGNSGLDSLAGRMRSGTHEGRNKRTVWSINPRPYKGAHFAVFPPELVEPCILAGTSERGCCPSCGAPWVRESRSESPDQWSLSCSCNAGEISLCTVLDPFSGTGTAGQVALDHGRNYIGLDLNENYLGLATARILSEQSPPDEEQDARQKEGGLFAHLPTNWEEPVE